MTKQKKKYRKKKTQYFSFYKFCISFLFSSIDFVHFFTWKNFQNRKKKTSFVLPILTDNRLQIEQFDSDMRRFIYLLLLVSYLFILFLIKE